MINPFKKAIQAVLRRIFGPLFFVAALAVFAIACTQECSTGAVCGDYNSIGPSQATPTPVPSPNATPDPCRVEGVRVGFMSGAQLPFLALGATEQLDATPVNASGEVPKGCNVAREPVWSAITPSTCQVIGSGYNPFVRGLRVGSCSITASLGNVVSVPFTVEVR